MVLAVAHPNPWSSPSPILCNLPKESKFRYFFLSMAQAAPHGTHLAQRSARLMHPRNPYKDQPPDFAALGA